MFSLCSRRAKDLLRLEGTTRFFGRQIPAHRNLGCLCSVVGAILFWVCFVPLGYKLLEIPGISGLILFCSIEAFLRGVWITLLMNRYAFLYVLLSVLVVPLTAPLWVWIYGFMNIWFFVYGGVVILSAAVGVLITRILQVRRIGSLS